MDDDFWESIPTFMKILVPIVYLVAFGVIGVIVWAIIKVVNHYTS